MLASSSLIADAVSACFIDAGFTVTPAKEQFFCFTRQYGNDKIQNGYWIKLYTEQAERFEFPCSDSNELLCKQDISCLFKSNRCGNTQNLADAYSMQGF